MTRVRFGRRAFGIVVLSLLAAGQLSAVSPSYILFYGNQLAAPVVLRLTAQANSEFLWSYSRPFTVVDGVRTRTIPGGLDGRPYLKYAVFWGRWAAAPTGPEGASQHGRFYLPTSTQLAAVVVTAADMEAPPPAEHPAASPIPTSLTGFWGGWMLTAADIALARTLGVPGLQADFDIRLR